MKSRHWLIVYDIRDPKRLAKVAKTLTSYGIRVQKSVFEMEAEDRMIKVLRKKLAGLIDNEDYIIYFPVCEDDRQKQEKFGVGKTILTNSESYHII